MYDLMDTFVLEMTFLDVLCLFQKFDQNHHNHHLFPRDLNVHHIHVHIDFCVIAEWHHNALYLHVFHCHLKDEVCFPDIDPGGELCFHLPDVVASLEHTDDSVHYVAAKKMAASVYNLAAHEMA